jgi:hypothetical protein
MVFEEDLDMVYRRNGSVFIGGIWYGFGDDFGAQSPRVRDIKIKVIR